MINPRISVIIPTFNRAHLIGATIDSIIAQSFTDWECILVDDGSEDDTLDILERYSRQDNRINYYTRPSKMKKGANSCRHFGFLKSVGVYINWFDSDDLMHKDHLQRKIESIEAGKYDFVVCEIARFKDDVTRLKINRNSYDGNDVENQFIGKLTLFTPGPLWRKSFLEENGLYYQSEEVSTVLNDWVFGINALLKSHNYFFLKMPLVYYRSHDESIYGTRKKREPNFLLDEYQIRKRMFGEVKLFGYDTKIVFNYMVDRTLFLIRSLYYANDLTSGIKIWKDFRKSYQDRLSLARRIRTDLALFSLKYFNKGIRFLK